MYVFSRKSRLFVIAGLICGSSLFWGQTSGVVNNWRAEHSRDTAESTNVQIDAHRGLETTGTPARAVWSRQVAVAGTYLLRVKYNPIAGREMKLAFNGTAVPTSGMNAKYGSDNDLDCEVSAKWRPLGNVTAVSGVNTLVIDPVDPAGKLPHICSWELVGK
jgi:hypothetical protein